MLDSITLATLTAAISSLGIECARGTASEAGKDAWRKISSLFGWKADQFQISNDVSSFSATVRRERSMLAELRTLNPAPFGSETD
jgi:hypothetical protein